MFQNLFQLPKLAQYAATSKKWLDLLEFDIRNVSLEHNSMSCTISFPEKLTGNEGIIHGGMICFVMDSIAGIHAQMFFNKNGTVLTKNISVDFLIPTQPKHVYRLMSFGKDTQVVVELSDEDRVYARGIVDLVMK